MGAGETGRRTTGEEGECGVDDAGAVRAEDRGVELLENYNF